MSDAIDRAQADSDAALNEFGLASDQLTDRLLLLGDHRAGELACRLMSTFQAVLTAEHALNTAAFEVMQDLHEKQLEVLGSNRQDAARRLLEAAGYR